MLAFLKKKLNLGQEETKPPARKPKKEEPKKVVRQAERDKHIESVMRKTGWDRKEAIDRMKAAKKLVGISYKDYDRNDFFNILEDDQDEVYQKIQERKARRRAQKEHREAEAVTRIMIVTSWDHDLVVERVREAQRRTGCTYGEYLAYRFYDMTRAQQDQVFVEALSQRISARYDVDPAFIKMLGRKADTNQYFQALLRRPWCVNTKISLEEFAEKFAGCRRIIYRPQEKSHGRATEAFPLSRDTVAEVYSRLVTMPEGVVEAYVVQHPEMSRLCSTAVNTIRLVTVSAGGGDEDFGWMTDVAYASLCMGGGHVFGSTKRGVMVAGIDLESGFIVTDATDNDGHMYERHPITGTRVKGFRVPCFREAVDMVREAIVAHQIQGYLGWDIAITEEGPVLIEVNPDPSAALLSIPYIAEKKSTKQIMKKYLRNGV